MSDEPRIVDISNDSILWSDGRVSRHDSGVELDPPPQTDPQTIDVSKTTVLVFHGLDVTSGSAVSDGLIMAWRDAGVDVSDMPTLVFLSEGQTVESLDDEDMRRCGWVRA